jgi:ABC-type molybdate transport system substrate-binding protein
VLAPRARIDQVHAVLKSAKEPALAKAFFDFLLGPGGRVVLEKSGHWPAS